MSQAVVRLAVLSCSLALILTSSPLIAADSAPGGDPTRAPAEALGERAPHVVADAAAPEFVDDPWTNPAAWDAVPEAMLDAIDHAALVAQDELDQLNGGVPFRVGIARRIAPAAINPLTSGLWLEQPDGTVVWRMKITTAGAAAVGVNFSRFDLPPGGRLLLAGLEDPQAPQEHQGSGPISRGFFNAPPVVGQTALLEYHGPAASQDDVALEISEIGHLYRDLWTGEAIGVGGVSLLPCQVDVKCRTVNETARDAVGRMYYQSGGFFYYCSGALLADNDTNTFAAYFLSANHCISTQAEVNTLTVYWKYQTNVCNGTVGTGGTTVGGTLLAHSDNTDFSFMRLTHDVNLGQGMAGWTTSGVSGTVYGIHHPGGSFKRYSGGATTGQQPICGGLPTSRYIYNDWNDGVTEGGSSGSPLFNTNWQVVGQLYGFCYFNQPACDNPQDYNNVYGKFSVTYPSISSWLTATIPDDSYEQNDSFPASRTIATGSHNLRLVDFDDYFDITLAAPSTITLDVTYSEADMDLRLWLYNSNLSLVGSSNLTNGAEHIQASVPPGKYYIRNSRTLRWGGSYTLAITATPSAPPCPADLDGDGAIGQGDLGILLADFNCPAPGCDADIDGDGDTDQGDLGILLASFGSDCP